nr:ATP-dependent helicase brm-like isoform X1 [Drosophila bipectinata]XP_043069057.1 ATP-dependent helicase brm-like isoform X1 [Drosophila bipectinata]
MASPSPANSPMPPPQAPSPMAPPSQSPAPSPHSPYPHQQPGPPQGPPPGAPPHMQGPPPPGHPGAYGHPMQHGPPGQGPPGHHMPPHHQGMIFSKGPHMGMQMPPTGPNMSPLGYQTHGMPPNVSVARLLKDIIWVLDEEELENFKEEVDFGSRGL